MCSKLKLTNITINRSHGKLKKAAKEEDHREMKIQKPMRNIRKTKQMNMRNYKVNLYRLINSMNMSIIVFQEINSHCLF